MVLSGRDRLVTVPSAAKRRIGPPEVTAGGTVPPGAAGVGVVRLVPVLAVGGPVPATGGPPAAWPGCAPHAPSHPATRTATIGGTTRVPRGRQRPLVGRVVTRPFSSTGG